MKINQEIIQRLQEVNRQSGVTTEEFSSLIIEPPFTILDIYNGQVDELSKPAKIVLEGHFRVNLHWLETGEGPRNIQPRYLINDRERELANNFLSLPDWAKKELLKKSEQYLVDQENEKNGKPTSLYAANAEERELLRMYRTFPQWAKDELMKNLCILLKKQNTSPLN